jgi:hypothetical protein
VTDLHLAFRSLFATPIVAAVAVLSLALGIGANTATCGTSPSSYGRDDGRVSDGKRRARARSAAFTEQP